MFTKSIQGWMVKENPLLVLRSDGDDLPMHWDDGIPWWWSWLPSYDDGKGTRNRWREKENTQSRLTERDIVLKMNDMEISDMMSYMKVLAAFKQESHTPYQKGDRNGSNS